VGQTIKMVCKPPQISGEKEHRKLNNEAGKVSQVKSVREIALKKYAISRRQKSNAIEETVIDNRKEIEKSRRDKRGKNECPCVVSFSILPYSTIDSLPSLFFCDTC